jgi:putative nucleotidyltransferase with HDIG domain
LQDPAAVADLKADLQAQYELGSFVYLRVADTSGREIVATEGGDRAGQLLTKAEKAALATGKPRATIAKCECGDWELMVTAPLVTADGEVYGVIRGHRPFALVAPSLIATTMGFALVVMLGAFIAVRLLRYMVNEAQREVDVRERALTTLDSRLDTSMHELEEHSVGTLQALVAAVDARDAYTAQHSLNVADYACAIARHMGLDDQVPLLERAALVHDIGKIGLAEEILSKPMGLTPAEYNSVKEHSLGGARIIEMVPSLSDAVPLVLHHHERWDGKGYPDGLKESDIPLLARVLAVADALDAMTSDRPYRAALPLARAKRELDNGRGAQFDPTVVDAALRAIDDRKIVIQGSLRPLTA